ncbi:uncharacterized protein [Nicotiana tomentosiformis]|uniref:uncharacterized protein n=1 Tax=Nicotiana tomentosiformis TaxID=4098 RepID=UPI00388C3521
MAWELETYTLFQEVVEIARRMERVCVQEREDGEAKRPQDSRVFSGAHTTVSTRTGRGFVSRLVYSALPATRSAAAIPSGQSSRPSQAQFQQPHLHRGCFECGDTSHIVRDRLTLRRGAPPQAILAPQIPKGPQAMVAAPVAAPPAPPARGGGQAGRGHPIGGGHTRCYAFLGRTEVVASDVVITGIVLICHRDASVLLDPGSIY